LSFCGVNMVRTPPAIPGGKAPRTLSRFQLSPDRERHVKAGLVTLRGTRVRLATRQSEVGGLPGKTAASNAFDPLGGSLGNQTPSDPVPK